MAASWGWRIRAGPTAQGSACPRSSSFAETQAQRAVPARDMQRWHGRAAAERGPRDALACMSSRKPVALSSRLSSMATIALAATSAAEPCRRGGGEAFTSKKKPGLQRRPGLRRQRRVGGWVVGWPGKQRGPTCHGGSGTMGRQKRRADTARGLNLRTGAALRAPPASRNVQAIGRVAQRHLDGR
jgi:hypothetical protein